MNVVRANKASGVSRFASSDPADIAWRRQQMAVDNDIEDVARNEQLEAQIEAWKADGLSVEERIEKLKAFFLTI